MKKKDPVFASDAPVWGGGFGSSLSRNRQFKDDNREDKTDLKIELRREALAAIAETGPARVLDCFAGTGVMWDAVWRGAAEYHGCDAEFSQVMKHPGPCFHTAAERAMRNLDLQRFNVFDFDAYGSPWEEVRILAARRSLAPGERIAVVMTDGAPRRALLGLTAFAMAELASVNPMAPGAHRRWPELAADAMEEAARRMGGHLERFRRMAGLIGPRGMFYSWALLCGGPGPQGGPEGQPQAPRQGGAGAEAPGGPAEAPQGAPGGPDRG